LLAVQMLNSQSFAAQKEPVSSLNRKPWARA
jgi:hypothetical protein